MANATIAAAAILTASLLSVPVSAQQATTAPEIAGAAPAAAAPQEDASQPVDLIRDEPDIYESLLGAAYGSAAWTWDVFTAALTQVMPPSPNELAKPVSDEEQTELFKLLNIAGYKLKEIDSEVGIIPTIAFDFALVRQLSEADIDYLEAELEHSRVLRPGLYTEIQRTIVGTVLAINSGKSYQVTEMTVQVLPLPKVTFSVAPVFAPLSEESSVLLRAIQRVDRNVRDIAKVQAADKAPFAAAMGSAAPVPVKATSAVTDEAQEPATPAQSRRFLGLDVPGWIFGGAIFFIVTGLLAELMRRLIRTGDRIVLPITYGCFAASGAMWLGLGYIIASWLIMTGGALVLGFAFVLLLQQIIGSDSRAVPPPTTDDSAVAAAE